jgi:single-strand DNA-binding protein
VPTYDMTGTVKVVMDQQTFDSGFTKREFVVTTEDDRYPQDIKFECVKDKVSLLDDVKEGQNVTVTFDLRGNEYNGRYFVNLTAWRLASGDESSSAGAAGGEASEEGPPLDQLHPPGEEADRIPF